MATRNLVLTQHLDEFIDHLVASGRYQNASEVMREGLRLMEEREAINAEKLRVLRAEIAIGVAEADAGNVTGFDDAEALRAHVAELGRQARAR